MQEDNEDYDDKTKPLVSIDGFDDDEDRTEGEETTEVSVMQGEHLKFSGQNVWIYAAEETEVDKTREFVVVDYKRAVQKWNDGKVVKTIFVEHGQKWPDTKKWNDDAPKDEWDEDDSGRPRGPWQRARVLYLLDLKTLERFTYPTSTVGGDICVREFRQRVKDMRDFYNNEKVLAVVRLATKFMPTRAGGRPRPHLDIVRFITMGGGSSAAIAPPKPTPVLPPGQTDKANGQPAGAAQPINQAKPTPQAPSGVQTVEEPTLSQKMGDDKVPWR